MHRGASLEHPGAPALKAVVLDFGGPVLLTPFERLPALERSLGLPPGTFGWRGRSTRPPTCSGGRCRPGS